MTAERIHELIRFHDLRANDVTYSPATRQAFRDTVEALRLVACSEPAHGVPEEKL